MSSIHPCRHSSMCLPAAFATARNLYSRAQEAVAAPQAKRIKRSVTKNFGSRLSLLMQLVTLMAESAGTDTAVRYSSLAVARRDRATW